jgi:cellulose synthase (UDP-forming)
MLYYQFALPRVVFVTAPLAICCLTSILLLFSEPDCLLCAAASVPRYLRWFANERPLSLQLLGEIYDIVLAFHLVLPTLVTMIFPKRGKFNVTDKGGLLDVGYFDFTVVRPPGGGLCWPWGWSAASSGRLAMTTLARIPTLSPSTSGGGSTV